MSLRLLKHIRVLGLKKGIRYWALEKKCIRNPDLVTQWATNCEKEAIRCNLRGDKPGEQTFDSWAKTLRESHANFLNKNQKLIGSLPEPKPN